MAFPLQASEISDKYETGREKHVQVPAESSHFFPFKNFSKVFGTKIFSKVFGTKVPKWDWLYLDD